MPFKGISFRFKTFLNKFQRAKLMLFYELRKPFAANHAFLSFIIITLATDTSRRSRSA